MKLRLWRKTLLAMSLMFVAPEGAVARPALFSDLSLTEAKAQAKKTNKLLLVDFTAAWCPPCGEMDKTTWEDSKVIKWFKENGIAIQVDVDKDKATAAALKITAMPSLVVFKTKDDEVDRQLGFQDSNDLISWLTSVNNGVTSMDKKQQDLETAKKKGGQQELDARYELAQAEVESKRYAEALENYVWLWQNMTKIRPSMIGVKYSFFASELTDLVAQYPAARARFAKLRDESELINLNDWMILNTVLGEDAQSLKWFDSVKNDDSQKDKLKSADIQLQPLLIKAGRWADVAILIKDPQVELKKSYALSQALVQEAEGMNPFPDDAAQIYAALLAAGRDEEAEKVAVESLKLQNTPEMREALVFTAVSAGQLKAPVQARLDEIDKTLSTDPVSSYKRGAAYLKLKKYDRAVANFSKAIELAPTEAVCYDGRESAYCEQKEFDKAMSDAEHIISVYPKSDRAYISRGFVHLKQKQDELALKDFEQALKLNPNDPLSHINESAVYNRQGKYQLAFDAADKAVKLDANNAGGFCNRGEAAFRLHRYEAALADLNKSIEIGEKLCGGENFYYRAKVYDALGKNDLAVLDKESAKKLGYSPTSDE